jgi:hypothetical protein
MPRYRTLATVMTGFVFFSSGAFIQSAFAQTDPSGAIRPPADSFVLEGQFRGPFQDTLIQRWSDKSNGVVCYLYIPVIVPGSPSGLNSGAQPSPKVYGPNQLGSISCVSPPVRAAR